jgi:hypothetical protein
MFLTARREDPQDAPAQLGVRQPFEHRIELHRCLWDRLATKKAGILDSAHLRQKLGERALPRLGELGAGAKAGHDSLEGDAIQSRVLDHEPSEYRDSDGDQIGDRIVGLDQPVDAVGKELEPALRAD